MSNLSGPVTRFRYNQIASGKDGVNGLNGAPGAPGAIGPAGPAGSSSYQPTLHSTSASVVAGDSVVSANQASNDHVTRAVAAAIANAPGVIGVVTVGAVAGGTPTVLTAGTIPASVSGLGAGVVAIAAINPTTGKIMRVQYPDGSEAVIGTVDTFGNVAVRPGGAVGTAPIMEFNIKAAPFFAVGDDTANDTAAIQAAFNAAASVGGIVKIPRGTYKTDPTLALTSVTGIIVRGEGQKSVIRPRGSTGAAIACNLSSNLRFEDFKIDGSAGTVPDGILLTDTVQSTIDITINGGTFGFTRGGVTLVGNSQNCYQITFGVLSWIAQCAGDGVHCVIGTSHTALAFRGHVQGNSGYGVLFDAGSVWAAGAAITVGSYWIPKASNGNYYVCTNAGSGTIGAAQPTWPTSAGSTAADSHGVVWTYVAAITGCNAHFECGVVEGNAKGEIAGAMWGVSVMGTHLESVGTDIACITPIGPFHGLTVGAGTIVENHATVSLYGNYGVDLYRYVNGTSDGLDISGVYFNLAPSGWVAIGPSVQGSVGENGGNGTVRYTNPGLGGPFFPAALNILDSGRTTQQQAILRVYTAGGAAMWEVQGAGATTVNATPTVAWDYPITVPGYGAASAFTGVVDFEIDVIGRDAAPSTDFFRGTLAGTFSNVAGTIDVVLDPLSKIRRKGAVGATASLALNGTQAEVTVTGLSGKTYYWAVIYRAVARP